VNGIAPLITAALQAGPWAFIGVAVLIIGLVLAGAYAYHVRERARARTITDTVGAVSPHGGVVTQKRGRQSLTVALPVPPLASPEVPPSLRPHVRMSPNVAAPQPLPADAPHQEIKR
jgi:hypothetical protein